MPTTTQFSIFLTAAFILAITPGPGILYVLARTIKGGRSEGVASSLGTAVGGLGHVVAAALGLSAILATSAVAFGVIKYIGAAYLIYLGVRTLLAAEAAHGSGEPLIKSSGRVAFYQGVMTELLNPKTAIFFLAFIPQFINPAATVIWQFILLGTISVCLNTSADFIVVFFAGPLGQRLQTSARLQRGQRLFSGWSLIALGTFTAVSGERK